MHEARVPAEFVQARSPTTIANVTRGHEGVQHEHRRHGPAKSAWKKICASDVVRRKSCLDWAAPGNTRSVSDRAIQIDPAAAGRRSIIVMRGEFFALCHVLFH